MNHPNRQFFRVFLALGTALLAVAAADGFAAGDPARGEEKSAICAACHGADGNSTVNIWPSIAGQHAEYILKQMVDIQSGDRNNEQMTPIIATMSNADFEDLAAYYAGQEPAGMEAAAEGLPAGEKIYRAGNPDRGLPACMACHGPAGRGNPAAGYPVVRGQHAEYTVASLRSYRAETRNNDNNGVMRIIAAKMTDSEMEAVANYMQGLY